MVVFVTAVSSGCTKPSIIKKDDSAGFNGSYEIVQSDLPVNWYIYYPPILDGYVDVSLDTTDAVEGNQSLKFVAREPPPAGRRQPPGLFQVSHAKSNTAYKVSFWLKNLDSKILLKIGTEGKDPLFGPSEAVKRDMAAHPPVVRVLGETETGTNSWRQFEYIFVTSETDPRIRFQLNMLQPGTLWIDDVRIEEVRTENVRFFPEIIRVSCSSPMVANSLRNSRMLKFLPGRIRKASRSPRINFCRFRQLMTGEINEALV